MRTPRTIPAGKFKAECLALLDRVANNGEVFIVTRRGRPVAKVTPPDAPRSKRVSLRVRTIGDIVAPTGDIWEADG